MMTEKSPIENTPLTATRIEQVEQDLRFWADKPIGISFDPRGTPLFSMIELARSYARRSVVPCRCNFACYLQRTTSYRLPYWGERLSKTVCDGVPLFA